MKRKKKILSAEEYRERAAKHRNALLASWRIFGKTGVFFLSGACVLVGICLAWFASNKTVSSDGMTVQGTAMGDFELAAAGSLSDVGAWDDLLLSDIMTGRLETIGEKSYVITESSKSSIRWAITEPSHMENLQKTGIYPGSLGEITFYIVAKKDGALRVTLDVSLDGATLSPEDSLPADALEILKGHVLLFADYDRDRKAYGGWISEDAQPWQLNLDYGDNMSEEHCTAVLQRTEEEKLIWSADNVQMDTAYPVTLYWIWPEVVGEYLFRDTKYAGNRPLLFPEDAGEENTGNPYAMPDSLLTGMCRADEGSLSNRYFRWTDRESFCSLATVSKLRRLREEGSHSPDYGQLCDYYNQADQYLGENIRYLKLCVDAQ